MAGRRNGLFSGLHWAAAAASVSRRRLRAAAAASGRARARARLDTTLNSLGARASSVSRAGQQCSIRRRKVGCLANLVCAWSAELKFFAQRKPNEWSNKIRRFALVLLFSIHRTIMYQLMKNFTSDENFRRPNLCVLFLSFVSIYLGCSLCL